MYKCEIKDPKECGKNYNTPTALVKFIRNGSGKLKAVLNEASCSDIYTVQVIALQRGNSCV